MLKKTFLDIPSSVVAAVASSATLLTAAITLTPLIGYEPLRYTVVGVIAFFAVLGTVRQHLLHGDRKKLQYLLRNRDVDKHVRTMREEYEAARVEVARLDQARLDAEEKVIHEHYTRRREAFQKTADDAERTWEKAMESRNKAFKGLEESRENLVRVTRIAAEVAERDQIAVGQAQEQEQEQR